LFIKLVNDDESNNRTTPDSSLSPLRKNTSEARLINNFDYQSSQRKKAHLDNDHLISQVVIEEDYDTILNPTVSMNFNDGFYLLNLFHYTILFFLN
jgi:hypothetical protein